MQLSELIKALSSFALMSGTLDVEVENIEIDSRKVTKGMLFCCIPGTLSDGHTFIEEALRNGAVGVVTEHDHDAAISPGVEVRVGEGEARHACALLSGAIEGNPSRELTMVGITGTNGKTTVAQMIGSILESSGYCTSVIGTLSGARTTPPAPELHRQLAQCLDEAISQGRKGSVVMEVSSHALDQNRVGGIVFDAAVFTNLSHEHLDYHGTMEAYFDAKARLFDPSVSRSAIVWADSQAGEQLCRRYPSAHRVSFHDASDITTQLGGTQFLWRGQSVNTPMIGLINVQNALLSLETALILGVSLSDAADALSGLATIPGRMEFVGKTTQGASVIVDYAHTPDALAGVLNEARTLVSTGGNVLIIFGCGGDRDQAKRPLMGAIASTSADIMIVTTDNPRHEEASDIAREILDGAVGLTDVHDVPDRRHAIEQAFLLANEGDIVVIAGKGHEANQIIGDVSTPFDDRVVALELIGKGL